MTEGVWYSHLVHGTDILTSRFQRATVDALGGVVCLFVNVTSRTAAAFYNLYSMPKYYFLRPKSSNSLKGKGFRRRVTHFSTFILQQPLPDFEEAGAISVGQKGIDQRIEPTVQQTQAKRITPVNRVRNRA